MKSKTAPTDVVSGAVAPVPASLAVLEARTEQRRLHLQLALEDLEVAVRQTLPDAVLEEEMPRRPYRTLAIAFAIGVATSLVV